MTRALLACGLLALAPLAHAASVVVYSNNFESGSTTGFSGAGAVVGSQGYSAYGFGTQLLQNDSAGNPATATTLTLTNLPTHTSLTLGFLLAIIDSWDGGPGNGCAPDIFNVRLDGASIFSNNFGNVRDGSCGSHGQDYGTANALFFPGPNNIDDTASSTNVGFNSRWNDSGYNMNLESLFQNIPHSASTARLEFFASGDGWQAGADESWGIDNVTVTLNGVPVAVPEPSSLALVGLALVGAGALRRRAGR